jgi:DNA-binding NarL/FixJ family response regulator
VGAVPDVERALVDLGRNEVDVVLLDYHLHGRNGMELLQAMNPWMKWAEGGEHRPAVLVCTGFADDALESQARLMGARGVLAKDRMASDLVPAVHAVAEGNGWYGNQICPLG